MNEISTGSPSTAGNMAKDANTQGPHAKVSAASANRSQQDLLEKLKHAVTEAEKNGWDLTAVYYDKLLPPGKRLIEAKLSKTDLKTLFQRLFAAEEVCRGVQRARTLHQHNLAGRFADRLNTEDILRALTLWEAY